MPRRASRSGGRLEPPSQSRISDAQLGPGEAGQDAEHLPVHLGQVGQAQRPLHEHLLELGPDLRDLIDEGGQVALRPQGQQLAQLVDAGLTRRQQRLHPVDDGQQPAPEHQLEGRVRLGVGVRGLGEHGREPPDHLLQHVVHRAVERAQGRDGRQGEGAAVVAAPALLGVAAQPGQQVGLALAGVARDHLQAGVAAVAHGLDVVEDQRADALVDAGDVGGVAKGVGEDGVGERVGRRGEQLTEDVLRGRIDRRDIRLYRATA